MTIAFGRLVPIQDNSEQRCRTKFGELIKMSFEDVDLLASIKIWFGGILAEIATRRSNCRVGVKHGISTVVGRIASSL